MLRFLPLVALTCLTTLVASSPVSAESPAEAARAERARRTILANIAKKLGRNTTGPVVVALLETTAGRDGVPHTEAKVILSMGREAASEEVANFLSGQGGAISTATNVNANTPRSRSFQLLKSFSPNQDAQAQQFAQTQQAIISQQLALKEQQLKAQIEFARRLQQSSRGGRGGRGGGYRPR